MSKGPLRLGRWPRQEGEDQPHHATPWSVCVLRLEPLRCIVGSIAPPDRIAPRLRRRGVGTTVTSNVYDPVALDTATHAALTARQPAASSRRMGFGPQARGAAASST